MFRNSQSGFVPGGRSPLRTGGARPEVRMTTEPVQKCRVLPFREFFVKLFRESGYDRKNPENLEAMFVDLEITASRFAIGTVEFVRGSSTTSKSEAGEPIFILGVRFKTGMKPANVPFSGTYQGSITHFRSLK